MELGKGCHAPAIWPLMLPMTLQFIIVMIATEINDRLQRKLDYVEEEGRILREQLDAVTGGTSSRNSWSTTIESAFIRGLVGS
jgi:hypothetical protein